MKIEDAVSLVKKIPRGLTKNEKRKVIIQKLMNKGLYLKDIIGITGLSKSIAGNIVRGIQDDIFKEKLRKNPDIRKLQEELK